MEDYLRCGEREKKRGSEISKAHWKGLVHRKRGKIQ
jgi:hypothetical protein